MAEFIKTLRVKPNATTKITPFEAHFGRKPNTPLSNIATSPKSSNLSWENTKLACLHQTLLTKPALTAEAMWNRDVNSEDELDINYRQSQQEPQVVRDNIPSSSKSTTVTKPTVAAEPVNPSGKRKATTSAEKPHRFTGWDSSDEEFDRQLLARFPIGAHLHLTNTIYDLIKEKRKFLSQKTGIARKIKKPGVFGAQFKILENGSIINYSPHTAWVREDGKQPRVRRHDGSMESVAQQPLKNLWLINIYLEPNLVFSKNTKAG